MKNSSSGSTEKDNLVPLYKMNSSSGCGRSLVSQTTVNVSTQNKDTLLSSMQVREIPCYAYVLQDAGTSGGWQAGDAYGLEFEEIQLPYNYIFGSSYPKQAGGRPQTTMISADVSLNSGSGSAGGATGNSTIQVYSLRPGESGTLEPQVVASSDKPTEGIH